MVNKLEAAWGKQPSSNRSEMVNKLEAGIPILQICHRQWVAEQVFRLKIDNRRSNTKRPPKPSGRARGVGVLQPVPLVRSTPSPPDTAPVSGTQLSSSSFASTSATNVDTTDEAHQATFTDDMVSVVPPAEPATPQRRRGPGRPPKKGKLKPKSKQLSVPEPSQTSTKSSSPPPPMQGAKRMNRSIPWLVANDIRSRVHEVEETEDCGSPEGYDTEGLPIWPTAPKSPRSRCRKPTAAQVEAWEEEKATLERRKAQAMRTIEKVEKQLQKHAAEGRLAGFPSTKHWTEVTDSDSPPRKKQKVAGDDDVEGKPVLYKKVSGKYVPA